VCFKGCPVNAITGEPKSMHTINPDTCIRCGICFQECRFDAIEIR